NPMVTLCYFLIAILHLLCGTSLSHCQFILYCVKLLLELSSASHAITSSIPVDPRTVIDTFDLNPVSKAFVCCPKCFSCYSLDDREG
ncbi:hypothetical protein EDD22DRAFT_741923, partial [Suillus occidentalis]